MIHLIPLVGMHFRPPAKVLLASLPVGHELWLQREPGNEYDPGAIAVYLASDSIPTEAYDNLEILLPGNGRTLEEILAQDEWQLGYVAANRTKKLDWEGLSAKELAPILDELYNGNHSAKLGFAPDGSPVLEIEIPDARGATLAKIEETGL